MDIPIRLQLWEGKIALLARLMRSALSVPLQAALIADMEVLVREAIATAEEAPLAWKAMVDRLIGTTTSNADPLGEAILRYFDSCIRLVEATLEGVESLVPKARERVAGMDRLEQMLPGLQKLRQRIDSSWPWAVRLVPPPVDPEQRKRILASGPGEPIGDLLARLKAGGPLVKE